MIEVNQGEQSSETLTRLMRQLADARRAAHANAQALEDARAEAAGATASGNEARAEVERLRVSQKRTLGRVQRVSALCVTAELNGAEHVAIDDVFAALLDVTA